MANDFQEWLNYAVRDLEAARFLQAMKPQPVEIICYHCEQCAEKAIKAIIVCKGAQGGLPKRHELVFLLQQIKNMVEISDRIYDCAASLTPYGISVRYPNDLELLAEDADLAIKYAEEILAWAGKICN